MSILIKGGRVITASDDYVADVLNRFRPETRRYMHAIVEPPITKRSTIRQSELLADALRAIDRDRAD